MGKMYYGPIDEKSEELLDVMGWPVIEKNKDEMIAELEAKNKELLEKNAELKEHNALLKEKLEKSENELFHNRLRINELEVELENKSAIGDKNS